MQRRIQRVSKMVLVLGFLFLLWGCTAGKGDTPSPAPTLAATFTQTPVATATATLHPTATPRPTATPVPVPVWGSMWEAFTCSQQVTRMPRKTVTGEGPNGPTWRGLLGQQLWPVQVGDKEWLPLRYEVYSHRTRQFSGHWVAEQVKVKGPKSEGIVVLNDLEPVPWREAIGEYDKSIWGEQRGVRYLEYGVVVYDWVTKQVYCLKWVGGQDRGDDLGELGLWAGPGGVMLWDPKGGKVYGLEGRGLEVAWEAPYESVARTAAEENYEEVWEKSYWNGKVWNLLTRAQTTNGREEWSTEGYEVATGAHQYVQLSPRPWGAWRDWMWADIKYSWDNKRLALLQEYNPTEELRVLVYPLGECLESGEALCEPKVYPLNKKYLDWERACQTVDQIFWSPRGDVLYLTIWRVWNITTPSWCEGVKVTAPLWKMNVTSGEKVWEPVEIKPTEAVLREVGLSAEAYAQGGIAPIAWDSEKERVLRQIKEGVFAWLYLEPKDERKIGEVDLMHDEVPFGLILPSR